MATNYDLKQRLNQNQLDNHINRSLEELRKIAETYKEQGKTPPQGVLAAIERAEMEDLSSPEAVEKRLQERQTGNTDEVK